MATYWLTPVDGEDPLVLGEARIHLAQGPVLEMFREKLYRRIHPRALPMVKAAILPGEPSRIEEDAPGSSCGAEDLPSLSEPGPVVFDGFPLSLSECGRAFIDRLPLAEEQWKWFNDALSDPAGDWTEQETDWLLTAAAWVRSGRRAMLVKEE